MKIAFVGKGGSGKSTLSASLAAFLQTYTKEPIVVFDADLNIHAPELLGFPSIPDTQHLSNPDVEKAIKTWLVGTNEMTDLGMFRKSTPPTPKSNIFFPGQLANSPLAQFGVHSGNLSVFAVGTYQPHDIGAGCYHNNLAILESLLSHTDDMNSYVIADMVAGVDSFAGTLHAQFDITYLIVEPTMRSIEVFNNYLTLAQEAQVSDSVFVIANKVRSEQDIHFIQTHISQDKIIGFFTDDSHIRDVDQTGFGINISALNPENISLLKTIADTLDTLPDQRDLRLRKIWELHKKYVAQPYIIKQYGDLSGQIDDTFSFRQHTS